jgi:hypothetical protein
VKAFLAPGVAGQQDVAAVTCPCQTFLGEHDPSLAVSLVDIVAAAGNAGGDGTYIGVEEDFNETADANGDVTIQFLPGSVGQPLVNAIAVVPTA